MLALSPAIHAGTGYSGVRPSTPEGVTSPYDVPHADSIAPARSSGPRYGTAAITEPSDRYGSPAGDTAYDREIKLGPSVRSVSVAHNETVRFVAPNGREFRWRFDTLRQLDVFPLARIAPPDVPTSPNVTVYINKGDARVNG